MKNFEETKMNKVAEKLIEFWLDQLIAGWAERLEQIAVRVGVDSDELKHLAKPLLQRALDKHFS